MMMMMMMMMMIMTTGSRVVVTGARKRQRFRESNSDVNDVSGELPEEPRRQGAPRRKVNR